MNKRVRHERCKDPDCRGIMTRQEIILPKFGEKIYLVCTKCGVKREVPKKGRRIIIDKNK
jgi:hypothetical protein